MTGALLQLEDYWATSVHVDANPDFVEASAPLDPDLINVTHAVKQLKSENVKEDGTKWLVDLAVEQSLAAEKSIPYSFRITMQAIVGAHPMLEGDRLQRVVSTNGPSMLFGSAREVIRAATGRGPYSAIIIPSTNFLPASGDKEKENAKETSKKPKPKKPKPKKPSRKKVATMTKS